ncbi:MAG: DUF1272 domain-containing protein [Chitinophagaceae bacterium]|nr:DUF1272 domain-containing protein [Chitinophagaceae bacterium]
MSMDMRPLCEQCNATLLQDGVAFICSYECSFCENCTETLHHICPNCGGELVRRPRRKIKEETPDQH